MNNSGSVLTVLMLLFFAFLLFLVGCCGGEKSFYGYDDCVFDLRSDLSLHMVFAIRSGDSLKVKLREGGEMRFTEYTFYNDPEECPLKDRHEMILGGNKKWLEK